MAFRIPTQLNKGKEFLDSVLAKLPEEDRAAVRAQYSQAQDELSGISREIAESVAVVNTTATEQAAWWEKNGKKPPVEEPNRITSAVDRDALMKDVRQELGAQADELSRQGLYLTTVIPTLIAQHGVEFGEVLDGRKLVDGAREAKTDVETYYHQSVAERRRTAADTKYKAEIAAATEAGRLAGLKEAGNGHMPYPVGHRAATTLDGLRKVPDGQQATNTLEAAVATATEMMQKQQSA